MATYVLVHGGGHGGWCWQRLTPLLQAAGHQVYAPTLTGLADQSHLLSPDVGLDTHIADVTALLLHEDLTEVILVGHSYGGMVITGAADRALGRIGHLVYLDAPRPRHGEALLDVYPSQMADLYTRHRVVDGVELVLIPGHDPFGYFGVTDPETIAWMHPKLTPHPWKCFAQPVSIVNQDAVDQLSRTNINCPTSFRDKTEEARARALDGFNVWELDAGHDMMICAPEAVAELLLKLSVLG